MGDPGRIRFLLGAGAIVGTAVLVGLVFVVPDLHTALGHVLDGDTGALRRQLRDMGVAGALVLVTLVLVHNIVPYPAEIALVVAGYVYGFWVGVPLMLVAWLASGLIGFQFGRSLGRPAARRVLGPARVDRFAGILDRAGAFPLVAVRLLPVVPFTLASVVAGALRVGVVRFSWTTVVGYIPLTCACVLLGGRLEHLSPTDPVLWGAVVLIIALLLPARSVLRRFERRAQWVVAADAPTAVGRRATADRRRVTDRPRPRPAPSDPAGPRTRPDPRPPAGPLR
ncbi:MAG: TVP38/TMEM64 family protein [Solirubrobacteraceae bacterium]